MTLSFPVGMQGWPLFLEDLTSIFLRGKTMCSLTKAFGELPLGHVAVGLTEGLKSVRSFSISVPLVQAFAILHSLQTLETTAFFCSKMFSGELERN